MKKCLRWLIPAFALCLTMTGCGQKQASQDFYAMDTVMNITAYGGKAEEAVDACVQYINNLEAQISRTRDDSEIAQVNTAQGETVELSDQTADILREALELSDKTDGYFDPTVAPLSDLWQIGTEEAHVPKQSEIEDTLTKVGHTRVQLDGSSVTMDSGMEIDLGGIGKGYAADHVVELLKEYNVKRAIVSLGGNIYVIGQKEKGVDWNVAVTDPDDESNYLGKLSVSDTSVVTSGDYERYFEQDGVRYCHIFDASTGCPAQTDLRSVTVVSPDSTSADAYTTALFVMGYDQAAKFCEENDIEAVFVCADQTVHVTDGLRDKFQLTNTEYTYVE